MFAMFDHGRNASEVGMKLPPNKVIVFGSPKVGTLLMQQDPSISLSCRYVSPFGEDADGKVWSVPRIWRRSPPNTGWKTAASSRRCKRP